MRPWLEGKINFIDLKNGNLSLDDVLLMNLAIDARHENERRVSEAQKKNA